MFGVNLFGLDKKSGFKVWNIKVENLNTDHPEAVMYITHGKDGGKQTTKIESFTSGKQGRTPYEQAISEAQGRIKKQRDKNYRETKEELKDIPLLPMLAGDYNKIGHRIEFPCYGSVKYDGVRCLVIKNNGVVTLQSRTGQPYSLKHLEDALLDFMKDGEIFDGEIYLHGQALQDINSATKRTDTQAKIDEFERKIAKHDADPKGSDQQWHAKWEELQMELDEAKLIHRIRPQLQFHIFDIINDDDFETRLREMDEIHAVRKFVSEFVLMTEYVVVANDEQLRTIHHPRAVREGFEGFMLRNKKGVNESGKRSADLQKFKTFVDEEFLITDIIEDKQGLAIFVLKNNVNDLQFRCVMGDLGERKVQILQKEQLKGKWLNVQFQTRNKGTLIPQFGTGKYIRDGYAASNGTFIPYD